MKNLVKLLGFLKFSGSSQIKDILLRFKEGKFRLRVKKKFYDGIRVNAETLKEYLEKATIANLVGEETVNCAIEAGIVDPDCVIRIQNVPHAQMVRML